MKATSPAPGPDEATNRTKATDRRRNRPTSDGHRPDPDPEQDGHEQRPPAHQDTDAPEAHAHDTREKAEQRQKPRPEGPPTANTESRAPEARAAERAKASAPEAQPTAPPYLPVTPSQTAASLLPLHGACHAALALRLRASSQDKRWSPGGAKRPSGSTSRTPSFLAWDSRAEVKPERENRAMKDFDNLPLLGYTICGGLKAAL
jgi:hypothetical protein